MCVCVCVCVCVHAPVPTHTQTQLVLPRNNISQILWAVTGSCAKIAQDASVFVRIIAYPYLSHSLLSIHCAWRYQWAH